MRWIVLVSLFLSGALVGCGSEKGGGGGDGQAASPFADAQAVVDRVAGRHADLQRLTLHAVPQGKTGATQIASTAPERRGKPSDPEDLQALQSGNEVVLDEPGAIDVTVPILVKDGKPTAVAGVTVKMASEADREASLNKARAIAAELEKEIGAAGKQLW